MGHSPDDTRHPRRLSAAAGVSRAAAAAVAALVLALFPIVLGPATAGAVPQASATTAVATASAVPDPGSAEADFTARINSLRASNGLAPLAVDAELVAQARAWATNMAGQGRIFHTSNLSNGISANWVKLGENVGVGADVAVLFQAFVDSPTHYANLVDPKYTRVGVGVVVSGDRIFTTHRFMAVDTAPPPPPPPPPAPVVTAVPPTTASPATAPPNTAPPNTAPPTTVAPTTTTTTRPPGSPAPKLGPIEQIAALVAPER